jgi:hypothetical protein
MVKPRESCSDKVDLSGGGGGEACDHRFGRHDARTSGQRVIRQLQSIRSLSATTEIPAAPPPARIASARFLRAA